MGKKSVRFEKPILSDFALLTIAHTFGVPVESVRNIYRVFPDRFAVLDDCVVIFLCLTDSSLDLVARRIIDISKADMLFPLFSETGDNVHFISVIADGSCCMLRMMRSFDCKSVSWFRPDWSKFVKFERR